MERIIVYRTAPNQKTIITKKTHSDKKLPYGKCNVAATLKAAKELSDRAFKLYVRMNLHQDKHKYALSPKAIQDEIGMSDKRYRMAVNELIENGYLFECNNHAGVFFFYEFPSHDLCLVEKYKLEDIQKERKAKKEKERQKGSVQKDPIGELEQLISMAKPDILPGQKENIARPKGPSNPAISGGEIERNIINNKINDNTDITTDAEVHSDSYYRDLQEYDEYMKEQMGLPALDEETSFSDLDDRFIIHSIEDYDTFFGDDDDSPF